MIHQESRQYAINGRGPYEITQDLAHIAKTSGIYTGTVHCFIRHTSASLIICENASPDVIVDLNHYFDQLVPDGSPDYTHNAEGPDDMAAHIRSILTTSHLTLPIVQGRLGLGTWQGVFIYEHRNAPHTREIVITIHG